MKKTYLHVVPVGSHEAFLEGGPALQRRLALLELHILPQQGCSPCLQNIPSPLSNMHEIPIFSRHAAPS